jgi:hypothetical protein
MSASLGEVCRFWVGPVFVAEIRLFSSLRITPRVSLRVPFTEVPEIIGLGSSLGAGDGRTAAIDLDLVSCASRYPRVASANTHFCVMATGGNIDLDIFVRGVGRTGVPAPTIHDFCLAPKRVLSVALDESISLSDRAGCPSLSGGRRMVQVSILADIRLEFMRV